MLSIEEPKLAVCGEQFIEGTHIEFMEYAGVMGDIAVADEDIADDTSEYIFCESMIDRGFHLVVIGGAVSLFTSRASSTNKLTLYLFQTRTDWKNKYSSSPVYLDTTSRCEVPGALGSQIQNRQGGRLP